MLKTLFYLQKKIGEYCFDSAQSPLYFSFSLDLFLEKYRFINYYFEEKSLRKMISIQIFL